VSHHLCYCHHQHHCHHYHLIPALTPPLLPLSFPTTPTTTTTSLLTQAHPVTSLTHRQRYTTHSDLAKISDLALVAAERNAPLYTLSMFDNDRCSVYLNMVWGPLVARRFDCMPDGAQKAELWRFALLYERGGV
jgi:hypothetical protein